MTRLLYLATGIFDKGGISRYARYQITALRELLGEESVRVYSLLGARSDDFEVPFAVDWSAGGVSLHHKVEYSGRAAGAAIRFKPDLILAGLVSLSPLAVGLSKTVGARSLLNVYGLEIWSRMSADSRWGLRQTDLVLSDSEFTANYIRQAGLRDAAMPIRVLPDCVDTERFQPGEPRPEVVASLGIPDPTRSVNILTLGRMTAAAAHKGFDRLLEAFRRAAPSDPRLRLIYAGSGELIDPLRRTADAAGLGDRVVFLGSVPEDALVDVYRACSVFSLVSDRGPGRGEGIPLTPLEAAACERPGLVGNQDGSREAVEDSVTGFVIDPFDLDGHAERLVQLAADEDLRLSMGKRARERIVERHDYGVFRDRLGRYLSKVGSRSEAGNVEAGSADRALRGVGE